MQRTFDFRRRIYFSGAESLMQLARCHVDDHYFVGPMQDPIGHPFANVDAGCTQYNVVKTLKVLHVHCAEDTDPGIQ
jgi:hypothetical protein